MKMKMIQPFAFRLLAKNSNNNDEPEVIKALASSTGTLVEFTEKKRAHIGKILSVDIDVLAHGSRFKTSFWWGAVKQ